MKNQDTLKTDWKYLIILDACRYDYFKKQYKHFLKGKLEPRKTPASYTQKWLQKTFTQHYPDIIYISPIFFCNSIKSLHKNGFNGKNHFYQVIDAWKQGWDNQYGTVPPWYIYRKAIQTTIKHPNKKIVIHFLQPHAPYLTIKPKIKTTRQTPNNKKTTQIKKTLIKKTSSIYHQLLGTETLWKTIKLLGLPPRTNMEETWRMIGTQGIKQAYQKNLQLVLFFTQKLNQHLPPGKIIITADHGELLGEKKYWGHGDPKPHLPELMTVPWMEVKRT